MDIALDQGSGHIDIDISNGDLKTDKGILTSVLIALFSEPWWGNSLGMELKSGIHTINKAGISLTYDVEKTAKELLMWLKDEQISEELQVETQLKNSKLEIDITITQSGSKNRYSLNWEGMK